MQNEVELMHFGRIISFEDQYQTEKAKAEIAVKTQLAVVVALNIGHFIRIRFSTLEGTA